MPWALILTLPLVVTICNGVVAREEAYLERRFGGDLPRLQGPRAPLAVAAAPGVAKRAQDVERR
jgi:hypothetical protein